MSFATESRKADLNYVVSGAFAVGGQSGACVLKRYEN
jgi:3-oxoacyl-(acyl-carrier-protein) synthase